MKTISYTFEDGTKYIGEFYETENDIGESYETYPVFHGKGKIINQDGEMYWGEWKDGEMHGKGTYTYPDGSKYVGEFKDGKEHGEGTYTLPDGLQYEGGWKDGKIHGKGIFTYPDGSEYVGEFKDGKILIIPTFLSEIRSYEKGIPDAVKFSNQDDELVTQKDFIHKLQEKTKREPRVATYLDKLIDMYRTRW